MSHISRRDALRYGAAVAAVVTGVAGAQALSTLGSADSAIAAPAGDQDPRDFAVEYRGKKIRGVHSSAGGSSPSGEALKRTDGHDVVINGRKLAVMESALPAAGGTTAGFISALNRYEPVLIHTGRNRGGLLTLTKRAVDALGDTELTAFAGTHHDHGR